MEALWPESHGCERQGPGWGQLCLIYKPVSQPRCFLLKQVEGAQGTGSHPLNIPTQM